MTVRAAIIGLGRWGRSLVNAVHGKTDAIKFVAACTRTRASAEEFCRERGIPMLARFEDALASPDIDAVVLGTPAQQHMPSRLWPPAVAGKHVHVEEPLTLDRPSAEAAATAAKRAGVVLAVGFNRRFHPSAVEIRKRIADRPNWHGDVDGRRNTPPRPRSSIAFDNWRAQPDQAPGGALTAVGVHSIDHMVEFGGRVRDVLPAPPGAMCRGRPTTPPMSCCGSRTGATGPAVLLGCDRDHAEFHAVRQQRPGGVLAAEPRPLPLCADLDRGAERTGDRAARRDHRDAGVRHAQRRAGRIRRLHRRHQSPYPVVIDQVLHGMAVFDAVVRSAKSRADREGRVSMEKLIITVAGDLRTSYPHNNLCPPQEDIAGVAQQYVDAVNAGAAIAHIHGRRTLEELIQADGKMVSKIHHADWKKLHDAIMGPCRSDHAVWRRVARAIEEKIELMKLGPDMMAVAFNAHDEYFQPVPTLPPKRMMAIHPVEELIAYAKAAEEHKVKLECECFQTGAFWHLEFVRPRRLSEEADLRDAVHRLAGRHLDAADRAGLAVLRRTTCRRICIWNVSVMNPEKQWSILSLAVALGGHVRVGYEDNPYIAPGEFAKNNAVLVDRMVGIAQRLGREVASPDEARKILGLQRSQ